MKLNRLKSIVNQVIRSSTGSIKAGYLIDPFYHHKPEYEITVNLISKTITPDLEGDDVQKYYNTICDWFHEVLPKEGILIDIIDEAIIKISPKEKRCIIKAQDRKFEAFIKY